jgi:hypothetical protein
MPRRHRAGWPRPRADAGSSGGPGATPASIGGRPAVDATTRYLRKCVNNAASALPARTPNRNFCGKVGGTLTAAPGKNPAADKAAEEVAKGAWGLC